MFSYIYAEGRINSGARGITYFVAHKTTEGIAALAADYLSTLYNNAAMNHKQIPLELQEVQKAMKKSDIHEVIKLWDAYAQAMNIHIMLHTIQPIVIVE